MISVPKQRRRVVKQIAWSVPTVIAVSLPVHAQSSVVTTVSPIAATTRALTTPPPIITVGDVAITQILWRQVTSNDPNVLVDEYVEIRNNEAVAVDITNWILRCLAQNFDFTFPSHIMQPGETCRIFTHAPQGANTWPCQFSFGRTSPGAAGNYIWNNTGDTAVLINAVMTTVDSKGYTSSSPSPIIF